MIKKNYIRTIEQKMKINTKFVNGSNQVKKPNQYTLTCNLPYTFKRLKIKLK